MRSASPHFVLHPPILSPCPPPHPSCLRVGSDAHAHARPHPLTAPSLSGTHCTPLTPPPSPSRRFATHTLSPHPSPPPPLPYQPSPPSLAAHPPRSPSTPPGGREAVFGCTPLPPPPPPPACVLSWLCLLVSAGNVGCEIECMRAGRTPHAPSTSRRAHPPVTRPSCALPPPPPPLPTHPPCRNAPARPARRSARTRGPRSACALPPWPASDPSAAAGSRGGDGVVTRPRHAGCKPRHP